MAKVIIYCKDYCPYCDRAKALFKDKGVEFEEINLEGQIEKFAELRQRTGMMTVPQIFINDTLVGGFTELAELEHKGELDALLK